MSTACTLMERFEMLLFDANIRLLQEGKIVPYNGATLQFDARQAPPCNVIPLKDLAMHADENGPTFENLQVD